MKRLWNALLYSLAGLRAAWDEPALRLEIDRGRASQLGLSSKEVIHNVITALPSDAMIAPSKGAA